jgi:hypothetical protein
MNFTKHTNQFILLDRACFIAIILFFNLFCNVNIVIRVVINFSKKKIHIIGNH